MRLRNRNSRIRPVSGENRDPMTRMDVLAPDSNSVRRAMNPARITSLNAGCVAMHMTQLRRRHDEHLTRLRRRGP